MGTECVYLYELRELAKYLDKLGDMFQNPLRCWDLITSVKLKRIINKLDTGRHLLTLHGQNLNGFT